MVVNLTFFKTTGKYHTAQTINVEDTLELWEIWNRVESMFDYGELEARGQCYILVDVPEHNHNHKRLIIRD